MAPPAGFHSTMQLPKRQLNKIIVLVEFVIYGSLRTPCFSFVCTHTLVFLTALTLRKRHLFSSPLNELLVGSIGSIVNSTLANDSKKLAL